MNNFFYNLGLQAAIKQNKVNEFANAFFDKMIDPPRRAVKAIPAGKMEAYYAYTNGKEYDTILNNFQRANEEVFWNENNRNNDSKTMSELLSERNKKFHQLTKQTVPNYPKYYEAVAEDLEPRVGNLKYLFSKDSQNAAIANITERGYAEDKNEGKVRPDYYQEYEELIRKKDFLKSAMEYFSDDKKFIDIVEQTYENIKDLENKDFFGSPAIEMNRMERSGEDETTVQKIIKRLTRFNPQAESLRVISDKNNQPIPDKENRIPHNLPHLMSGDASDKKDAKSKAEEIEENNRKHLPEAKRSHSFRKSGPYRPEIDEGIVLGKSNNVLYEFGNNPEQLLLKADYNYKQAEDLYVNSTDPEFSSLAEKIVNRNHEISRRRRGLINDGKEIPPLLPAEPDAVFRVFREGTFNRFEAIIDEKLKEIEDSGGKLDGKEFGGVFVFDAETGEEFVLEIENKSQGDYENRVEYSLNLGDSDEIRKAIYKKELEPIKEALKINQTFLPVNASFIVNAIQDKYAETELENRRELDKGRYIPTGTWHFHPEDTGKARYQKRPTVGFAEYSGATNIRKGDLNADIDLKRKGVPVKSLHSEYDRLRGEHGENTLEYFDAAEGKYFPKNFHYGEVVISVENGEPKMFFHDDYGNGLERTFKDYRKIYKKFGNGNE